MQVQRTIRRRTTLWLKLAAVLAVAILLGTLFPGPSGATGDTVAANSIDEIPKSGWDFGIYALANETFPKYAVGSNFFAYFADSADATEVLRIESLRGEAISLSVRPLANGTKALEQVRGSVVQSTDNKAAFQGAWGPSSHLAYEVGLTGIKETVRIDERPEASGDVFVAADVTFDQEDLTPQFNGTNLTGYAHWAGDVTFVNSTGAERFRIPQAFVVDSGAANGRGPKSLWLEYQLERKGGALTISAVVPEKYLDDDTVVWPIYVDPTVVLPPEISGQHQYADCTIYMESSLLLLQTAPPFTSLTLDRCTMFFNGPYQLEVSPTATLTLRNSTVRSNGSALEYGFFMNGSLVMDSSSILNTTTGIRAASYEAISIQGSTIDKSSGDGLAILASANSMVVNSSRIQNVNGAGLRIDTGGGFSATINGTSVIGAAEGIAVGNTTLVIPITNSTLKNITGAAVHLDFATATYNNVTIQNASETLRAHNSSVVSVNVSARYVAAGTTCVDSTALLDEVRIDGIAGIGFNGTNCEATWIDGNYYAWKRSLNASSFTVKHRLDILLLNATDAPVSGTSIGFYDAQGNQEGSAVTTGSDGFARGNILREFAVAINGTYTFYTHHRIDVLITGTPSVHYYVGGKRTLILHATNDADADGLLNAQEDLWQNVTWIEAEYAMRADGQSYLDTYASGSASIRAAPDGGYFGELSWPVIQNGTYQLLVRAAGNGLNSSLDLNISYPNGTTVLSTEAHNLSSGYTWVSSRPFTIPSASRVLVNATSTVPTNSTLLPAEAVLIDKFAFVRLKNGTGQALSFAQGQRTDPLDNDTDFDGARDGTEATPARAWFEAEVLAPSAPAVTSDIASSGIGIVHPSGLGTVLSSTLYGYVVSAQNTYQMYFRARALHGSSANATIIATSGAAMGTGTFAVGDMWQWVAGPTLTTGSSPPAIQLTVIDADDPNLGDATNYLSLDEVAVFNVASVNMTAGWFNATSPLDPDLDRDGLPDGPELDGFFSSDIIQAENYTAAGSVEMRPAGIRFNNSVAWANYTVQVRYAGMYRFLVEPLFEVSEDAASMPYSVLQNLLKAEVRDANQALVAPALTAFPAFPYTNLSTIAGGMNQVGGFYDGRFNLSVANYSFNVSIDLQKAATLGSQGRIFRIAFDQFYLQKFRLNATDWDRDSDLVPDGYEVNRSMLPLRSDSDYDLLDDFEEIHEGLDGFVTSPIRNDTDGDGLLDPVEVGFAGDADNTTRTNPTNSDTDVDGLPDGWVDGWAWLENASRFGQTWQWRDGLRQPWEGEDLNGNGQVNTAGYLLDENATSVGGETDPNLVDTDNDTMDDGWEVIGRSVYGTIYTLDPRVDDSLGNPENDALSNYREYAAGTNPYAQDTDGDLVRDGDEVRVMLRTNVTAGATNTSGYANATANSWIYFDINPYDVGGETVYWFHNATLNLTADSGLAPNRTQWLKVLNDGGLVLYNAALEEIVVWHYDSDPFDVNNDGVLEGYAYEFLLNGTIGAETSTLPVLGYKGREVIGPVNPLVGDSDADDNTDGNEGYWDGVSETADWWQDYDGDGFVAAADTDADGDGLSDGTENPDWDKTIEPEEGETAPFASDTDYDGIPDGNDSLPLDQDNDGLTGYGGHGPFEAWVPAFGGIEGIYGTEPTNPDTDGDWLMDGEEDANHNGTRDAKETNATDADTDDDGLWDGPLVRNDASNVSVAVQSWMWPPGNVSNATVGGANALWFDEPAWYIDEVVANYNRSDLTFKQYLVTANFTEPGPSTNVTRVLNVRLDSKAWWQTHVRINTTAPNWTTVVLGHILVPMGGHHILSVASDLGGFYLANLTLTPVTLSEGWFGTDPLHRDSDRDWLADGAEVGLNASLVTGGPGHLTATDTNNMTQNTNGFWSDPMDRDTDKDGLRDGGMDWNDTLYGETYYHTNPASADTDGDRLSDWVEVLQTKTNASNPDTDGDWLPDSYEQLLDQENDSLPAVLDFDSDNNSTNPATWVPDYNSTELISGAQAPLTAVFRTNASRGEYWKPRTWAAANITQGASLGGFVYDANTTDLTGYSQLLFYTHVRSAENDTSGSDWYAHSVTTFEGYGVYYNGTHLAVRVNAGFAYRFRAWDGQTDPPLPLDSRLTFLNGSSSSFKYRETINWSAIFLGADADGDGLNTAEEQRASTSATDPDSDDDDFGDGFEVYGYRDPISGRNYTGDPKKNDTDGDGLLDGAEIKWPNGYSSDPRDVDTDNDGAWDGWNTTGPSGMPNPTNWTLGEWRNGTNPLDLDTDDDGIPDGWELTYGFNATNVSDPTVDDPLGAADFDGANNSQEYCWGRNLDNDTWNETINGVWWNGTNPLKLDTDNDTMPDGWEMWFGLNATLAADGPMHEDFDNLTNAQEYNWSIISPWNVSRSWAPYLSANPFLNDTDGDGMNDDYELAGDRRDRDVDGVPSAADHDSDGDGLADAIEVGGWEVGVVTAEAARRYLTMEKLLNSTAFIWYNVTSDPFDNDTENDGIEDLQEFDEYSDPRMADTDGDRVNDSSDRIWDPRGNDWLSMSSSQDLEPPTFDQPSQAAGNPLEAWIPWKYSLGSCSTMASPLPLGVLCVNISFVVNDPNGIVSLLFTNLASGVKVDAKEHGFERRVTSTQGTTTIEGWVLVPLVGQSEADGQFQVLVATEDSLGNVNRTVVYGGSTYEKWNAEIEKLEAGALDWMRRFGNCSWGTDIHRDLLEREQCLIMKAHDFGKWYGFDMGWAGGFIIDKDWVDRYGEVTGRAEGSCDEACVRALLGIWNGDLDAWIANNTWDCAGHPKLDMNGWLGFAWGIGQQLNPFEPTFEDLLNLSTYYGTVNLRCQAKYNTTNASNFVLWMHGFFEGSKLGGMMYQIVEIAVSLLPFGTILRFGKALAGALEGALRALRGLPRAIATNELIAIRGFLGVSRAAPAEALTSAAQGGTVLQQTGGSVARAVRAGEGLMGDIPKLRTILRMPAAASDAEVVAQALASRVPQVVTRIEAAGILSPVELERALQTWLGAAFRNNGKMAMIGEGVEARLEPLATVLRQSGLEVKLFRPSAPMLTKDVLMAENKAWIREMRSNYMPIWDIGPMEGRAKFPFPTSDYYSMELGELRGYSNWWRDWRP